MKNKLLTKHERLSGFEIAYSEHGNGEALLLLHGNSGNKKMYKKYQQKYFSNFHTYAVDSRGHGKSKPNTCDYSIDQYSNDIIEFCSKLGLKNINVIGYSDGGNIALLLGKKNPELFKCLILVSPNYLVSGIKENALSVFRKINNICLFLGKIGFNTLNWISRFKLLFNDIGIEKEEFAEIKAKMHIIYAEKDLVKEDHLIEMHKNIPSSSIMKIEDCNHINIMESKRAIEEMLKIINT